MRPPPILRDAALIGGTGFVLFAFSERLFWSFWHTDDGFVAIAGGWLIYSLFAALLLKVMVAFRIGGLPSRVLVGALFGWLVEGVYAMTLYGDPSMPFPLTIAWTALAWHGPLSVVIGLFGLRRVLQAERMRGILLLATALGLFWGFWGAGWAAETPPLIASPVAFLAHAAAVTLGLGVSQAAITFGMPQRFEPSRLAVALAVAVVALFFVAVTVPAIPWSPLVLGPLLAILFLALRRSRQGAEAPRMLDAMAGRVRARNVAALGLMPLVATATYAVLTAEGPPLPSHQIVAVLSMLGGSIAVVAALLKAGFLPAAGRRGPTVPAPAQF